MHRFLAISAVVFSLNACAKKVEEPAQPAPAPSATAALAAPEASKAEPPPVAAPPPAPSAAPVDPALLKPAAATLKAPPKFKVKFTTTKGDFVVETTRAWAPLGADRFYNLVKLGFYSDVGFFRVVPDFVVQFGIHGNPEVAKAWKEAAIKDEEGAGKKAKKQSNEKGTLTYAKGGPNSRTTQLFINYKDNPRLDEMGFPPFAKIIQGMEVVDAINKEYGEQPDQGGIQANGNAYLRRDFPRLDYVKSAEIMK